MTGYTKLFGSIIASTIWREPNETRIVWITLLAMANRHGIVEASIPGLADMARVSVEECQAAVVALESPDRWSRTKEHEGRRIEPIDGGWLVLNHSKYRQKMNADDRRDYMAQKQRERRARVKRQSTNVNDCNVASTEFTQAEAAPSPKAEAISVAKATSCASRFEEFWKAYPKKKAKGEAERAWKKMKCEALSDKIMATLSVAIASHDWTKEAGAYIPYPATWLNRKGWEDEFHGNNHTTQSRFGI